MAQSLMSFLVILNPFALCLYLTAIIDEVGMRHFLVVLLRACGISLVAFWVAALGGETLLTGYLGISPWALRAFGGVIFLLIAYRYVMQGSKATVALRGSLDELPSAIALPFMVGAGTITQAILIGERYAPSQSLVLLLSAVAITFATVVAFMIVRHYLHRRHERIFERYVNILVRLNGLIIGAFSVEMIVRGVRNLWGE